MPHFFSFLALFRKTGCLSWFKQLIVFSLLFCLHPHKQVHPLYPGFQVFLGKNSPSGYYFLCPIKKELGPPAVSPAHLILDSSGQVVYYKVFEPGANAGDFELQPNGLMSYSYNDTFYLIDSTFKIVDSVYCRNGIYTDRHDFHILPNGHFLMLGYEYVMMDLHSVHFAADIGDRNLGNTHKVKCGVIQELDSEKKVVFEWHAIAHYAVGDADTSYFEDSGVLDWTHFNSIYPDTDGNLLLSVRNFNEVTKIDRSNGSIIWRLGGKMNQFQFLNDSAEFKGQHDVHRIPGGKIVLFDNGNKSKPLHPACGKEYCIDEQRKEIALSWSFMPDINSFSSGLGNVQLISNGARLVNGGRLTHDSEACTVVDSNNIPAFKLVFNGAMVSYRIYNYPRLPWGVKRPEITYKQCNGGWVLTAEKGHKNYLWSNGATTQSIAVRGPGQYCVIVPSEQGGYLSSEAVKIR